MFQWKQKTYPIWKLEQSQRDPVWWKHSILFFTSNNNFPNHAQCIKVLSSDRLVTPNNLCIWFFLKSNRNEYKIWKQLLLKSKRKKIPQSEMYYTSFIWRKSLIKISLIQDSSTEQRLFMLLPTLISTIVLTETFFDIKNSFKVKSSFAKVNFLLKTNTLYQQQRKLPT